jgi:hypothetical protein
VHHGRFQDLFWEYIIDRVASYSSTTTSVALEPLLTLDPLSSVKVPGDVKKFIHMLKNVLEPGLTDDNAPI